MTALFSLYGWTAREAAVRALRAWPVALSSFLYLGILSVSSWLVRPFGATVGGFIVGFIQALCISSYLYLVGCAVAGTRLGLQELKQSFTALLWDVIGVFFFLWIAGMVLGFVAQGLGDHAQFLGAAWALAVAVLLNPVPEHIYQRRTNGRTTELLLDCVRFVQHHWIEWFVPNLVIGLALLLLAYGREAFSVETLTLELPSLFSIQGAFQLANTLIDLRAVEDLWKVPVIIALVHLAMVFRGVLFKDLISGNWRTRAFRARTR